VRALGSTLVEISGTPGAVLDDHLTIGCGEGALRLTELQRAGKCPMPAEDFLRGVKLGPGMAVS
jgi:methionyl-tRNA formyltransferase